MFEGKRALVLGVANKRSIAWAIAKRLADGGAKLAFTFQGERIEKNVRELADSVQSPLVTELDVRDDAAIDRVFAEVGEAFDGELDILVHSVAFAAAEDLEGRFTDTPRDRFWMAIDVSAYSLVATHASGRAADEAAGGGSIVTMTYLGGERAVPHYNVMGVAKATLDRRSSTSRGTSAEEHPGQRDLGRAGAHARRALDRRLPDDGVDSRSARRCIATSTPTTSAPRPPTSSRTARGTSPARRSTSIPGTTRWGCSKTRTVTFKNIAGIEVASPLVFCSLKSASSSACSSSSRPPAAAAAYAFIVGP